MTILFNKSQQTHFRKQLRNNMTKSETILWKYLKGSQLEGFKFRRQYGIGKYVVDFYCPKLKLAIEVDGLTHNEEIVFQKDMAKDDYLKSLNLTVIRYNTEQIFKSINDVISDLYNKCKELSDNHPRPFRSSPP